jgi:tRNA pseudouridine32 synthase/23S rRNA pseudouridine746 synthase
MRPVVELPLRHGVAASTLVLPRGDWPTLLDFLIERFPNLTASQIATRVNAGEVLDPNGRPLASDAPFQTGLRIHYYRHIEDEARIPFEETILFRDEHILVADKPHFLPMSPVGAYAKETLLARLKVATGMATLAPMHRLDRETAGVVAFTLKPAVRGVYQRMFATRAVEKVYEAIAPWRADVALPRLVRHRLEPDDHFMRMRVADGMPNAETQVELIEHGNALARYRLTPSTGKKHQLRVQMAALGLPIVGDAIYPVFRHDPGFAQPLQLLAKRLAFVDPITGVYREFVSQRTLIPME